jgi:hypothetical protein
MVGGSDEQDGAAGSSMTKGCSSLIGGSAMKSCARKRAEEGMAGGEGRKEEGMEGKRTEEGIEGKRTEEGMEGNKGRR